MKKVLLILSLTAIVFSAKAQDKTFKPSAGNVTLEANFAPFSGAPLSMNYVKGRYFLAEDMAARLGFGLSINTNSPNDTQRDRVINFSLAPGVEKHFAGTDRLSPYVGAELLLVNQSRRQENTDGGNRTVVKNAGRAGYFTFGLGGVVGADFYFSKHVYMGLELGYGIGYTKVKDTVVESSVVTTTVNGSSFSFSPSINSALRIGFVLF